jgi:predicted translin family RNA/ssDNA-binding protein
MFDAHQETIVPTRNHDHHIGLTDFLTAEIDSHTLILNTANDEILRIEMLRSSGIHVSLRLKKDREAAQKEANAADKKIKELQNALIWANEYMNQ